MGVAPDTPPVALLQWHVDGTARGVGQRVTDDRLQRSRTLVVRHNRERGASSPESDPVMASLLEESSGQMGHLDPL